MRNAQLDGNRIVSWGMAAAVATVMLVYWCRYDILTHPIRLFLKRELGWDKSNFLGWDDVILPEDTQRSSTSYAVQWRKQSWTWYEWEEKERRHLAKFHFLFFKYDFVWFGSEGVSTGLRFLSLRLTHA